MSNFATRELRKNWQSYVFAGGIAASAVVLAMTANSFIDEPKPAGPPQPVVGQAVVRIACPDSQRPDGLSAAILKPNPEYPNGRVSVRFACRDARGTAFSIGKASLKDNIDQSKWPSAGQQSYTVTYESMPEVAPELDLSRVNSESVSGGIVRAVDFEIEGAHNLISINPDI